MKTDFTFLYFHFSYSLQAFGTFPSVGKTNTMLMPAIFIVDDDTDILFSLERFFRSKSYGVKTFCDGHSLMEEISRDKPELVLLDINLKSEDGRSLCYDIKTASSNAVKVLLISADPVALLSYENSYADGIINKPFRFADLERKCNNLLPHKRSWLD